MKLSALLGSKPKEEKRMHIVPTEDPQIQITNEDSSQEEKEEVDKHLITITWGTGMPIDIIFDNARKAYALAAASRLIARRETFEEHLAEINEMQTLLDNNDPKMLTMIESYRRGFQKGMAAVAINFINNQ